MSSQFPFRQIHLDFHTGPNIPDVGKNFDADAFAEQLVEARVNSVTLFAKCHHGHLYYDTKHPARHPGLKKDLNLLGEQVEALHKRGIRAPIYLSVTWDEFAAKTHPEWRAVLPENKLAGSPLEACWHNLDMSSPYQDYLAEQLSEVLKMFHPVDGIFFDICFDQQSISTWALAGMLKAKLNPEKEEDRIAYAHKVSLNYMTRYKGIVDAASKKKETPVAFNSRPMWNLAEEKKFLRHVEIEALPTGGWGYMYFPLNVRFARTFGLPTLGMTGRFHKSWADFGGLKPQAALMYECCQILAHGARCSVGDQLHPRGILDAGVYDMIGSVYSHIEACEPWCDGAKPVTDIAILTVSDQGYHSKPGNAHEGAVRALTQLGHQFDFIALDASFDTYKTIIVPEGVIVTPKLAVRLKAFVGKGGSVLLSGQAGFDSEGKPVLGELQGVSNVGESPFTCTYMRFQDAFAKGIASNSDHVMYERGLRLKAKTGAQGFVRIIEPYFERSWEHFSSHFQTPGDKISPYMAVVRKGRVVTCAFPVFKTYGTHGNLSSRHLIGKMLELLLPEPLIRISSPSFVETTVTRQAKRTIVHLLGYAPVRRAPNLDIVEEASLVKDLPVSLRLPNAPKKVMLQPAGKSIPFTYDKGYAKLVLPELNGHAMIVFE